MVEPRSNVNLFEEDASRVDSSELLLSRDDDRDTNTPHLISGHTGAKGGKLVNESSFIFKFPVEENLDKFGLASALMKRKKETSPATISDYCDAVEVDAKIGNCSSTQAFSQNLFEALFTYWTESTDTITFSRGESSCNLTSLTYNEQASAVRDLSVASLAKFSSIASSESEKVMTANGAQDQIIEEGNILSTQSKESKKSGPFQDERNVNTSENLRKIMTEKIARLKLELLLREKKAGAGRQGKSGIGDTVDNTARINEETDVIMTAAESGSQGGHVLLGGHDTSHVDNGGLILSDEQALRAAALRSQKKRSVFFEAKNSMLEANLGTVEGKWGSVEEASARARVAEAALRESALRSMKKRTAGTRDVEAENERSAKLIRVEEFTNSVHENFQSNGTENALLNSMDRTSTSSFDCASSAFAVMHDIRSPDLKVSQSSDAASMDVHTSNLQQESVVVVVTGDAGTAGDNSCQVNDDDDGDDDGRADVLELDNDEVDGGEGGNGGDNKVRDGDDDGRVSNDYGGDVIVVNNNESNMQINTQSPSTKKIVTIEANSNREQVEQGGGGGDRVKRRRNREDEMEGEDDYKDNKKSDSENEDAVEIDKEIHRMRIIRETLHYKLRPYSVSEVESVLGPLTGIKQNDWMERVDALLPDSEVLASIQKVFKKCRNSDINEEIRLYLLYNANVKGQKSHEIAVRYFKYLNTSGSRDCSDGRVHFIANYLDDDARECVRRLGLVKICRLYPEYFTVIEKKTKKNESNDKDDNDRNNNIKNNYNKNNDSNDNDDDDDGGDENKPHDVYDENIIKISASSCLNEMDKLYDSIVFADKKIKQKECLEFLKTKQQVTMTNPNYWNNMTENEIKCVRNFHYNKEKMLKLAQSIHSYITLYPAYTKRQIASHFCTGEVNSTAYKAIKYLGLATICVSFDQLFEVQNAYHVKDMKIIPLNESQSEWVEHLMSSRHFKERKGREETVCSKDEQTFSFANTNTNDKDHSNSYTNTKSKTKTNENAKTNANAKTSVKVNVNKSNSSKRSNNNTDAKNNNINHSSNSNPSYSNNIIYGDITHNNNNNNKNANKSIIDYGNKNNNNNNNNTNVNKSSISKNIVYVDNHNIKKGTEIDSEEEGEICENPLIHQNKISKSKQSRDVPHTISDIITTFQSQSQSPSRSQSQLQVQLQSQLQVHLQLKSQVADGEYGDAVNEVVGNKNQSRRCVSDEYRERLNALTVNTCTPTTAAAAAAATAQTSVRVAAAVAATAQTSVRVTAAAAITKSIEKKRNEEECSKRRGRKGMKQLMRHQTESTPHNTLQYNPLLFMSSSVEHEQQQQQQRPQLQQQQLQLHVTNTTIPVPITIQDNIPINKNKIATIKVNGEEKIALIKPDGTVQQVKKRHILGIAKLLHQYLEEEALKLNSARSSSSVSDFMVEINLKGTFLSLVINCLLPFLRINFYISSSIYSFIYLFCLYARYFYLQSHPIIYHFVFIASHSTLLYDAMFVMILYCTVLYCTVQCSTVLYCTVLYCTVFF